MWVLPHVVAELELAEIRADVLLRDADVGAIDPALHEVPEALNVRRGLAVYLELAVGALDAGVLIALAE